MNRASTGWMWTHSGKQYWPLNPKSGDIDIADIAHNLSMLCRFAGNTRHFYSVAEHSILVSLMVPPELALEGLLHDATEAYCGDLIRPLKQVCPEYQNIESLNDAAVRIRFKLPPYEHRLVKEADNNILHTEYKVLMPPMPEDLQAQNPGTFDPTVRLFLWPPAQAEIAFLNRYGALMRASGIRNS